MFTVLSIFSVVRFGYMMYVLVRPETINDNTCSIISYINSIIFALVIPMVCHKKEQLL